MLITQIQDSDPHFLLLENNSQLNFLQSLKQILGSRFTAI